MRFVDGHEIKIRICLKSPSRVAPESSPARTAGLRETRPRHKNADLIEITYSFRFGLNNKEEESAKSMLNILSNTNKILYNMQPNILLIPDDSVSAMYESCANNILHLKIKYAVFVGEGGDKCNTDDTLFYVYMRESNLFSKFLTQKIKLGRDSVLKEILEFKTKYN